MKIGDYDWHKNISEVMDVLQTTRPENQPHGSITKDRVELDFVRTAYGRATRVLGVIIKTTSYPAFIRKVMVKNGEIDDDKLRAKYAEVIAVQREADERDAARNENDRARAKVRESIVAKFPDANFRRLSVLDGDMVSVEFGATVTLEELTEIIENMRADNNPLLKGGGGGW